jgi:hypothetical protein
MPRTINGRAVRSAKVFESNGLWRWRIVDALGQEFLDGGNHKTREAADTGLDAAYDPPTDEQAAELRKLIADGGYSQRGAAKELQISERMMRYYCAGEQPVPRVVMLAMRHLVHCPPHE